MRKKLTFNILLSLTSGMFLSLSFPFPEFWYLAFIAFLPLLFLLKRASLKQSFFLSYISGIIFFSGLLYWLGSVTLTKLILLVLYLGLYFGIFGLLISKFQLLNKKQEPKTILFSLILIPSIWVSLEFIRSHIFSGFGWGLLGYSQYRNLYFIQIADITGAYGVSFLVMMVNVSIYQIIRAISDTSDQKSVNKSKILLSSLFSLLLSLSFIIIILIYGHFKLAQKIEGRKLKVSIIQGNIPQSKKWKSKYREWIITRHLALTVKSAQENPDLIVWPEASFPGRFNRDIDLRNKVLIWGRHLKKPLLIGAIVNAERRGIDPYNCAILISSQGKVVKKYNKLKLVPFSEYVIFSKKIPALRKLALSANLTPGKKYTVFKLNNSTFSTLICYEVIFEDLVRKFVKNGANLLINISNDAWYRYSPASFQQLQALVFRAVENRKSAIRVDNIGISCFITPKGKIYGEVKNKKGERLQVAGYRTENVLIANNSTLYNRYGNLFVYFCILISLGGIIKRKF